MKECTSCHKLLELKMFGKKTQNIGGLYNQCKECINTRSKIYKKTGQEKNKITVKKYYLEHKQKIREYHRQYMQEPSRILSERSRQREKRRQRSALKRQLKESYTIQDEAYTISLFNHCCANCGSTDRLQIDHHNPLSKGNVLSKNNAVVLCISCNSGKRDKLPEEFYTPEKLQWITEKLSK